MIRMRLGGRSRLWGSDAGAVVVWMLGVVMLTYLAVGVLVDVGAALTAKTVTLDTAQQAARAGAGQLDLTILRRDGRLQIDPAAAQRAAETFLATAGYDGTVTASTTAVQVIARTHQPTVLLHVVGLRSLTLTATATAARSSS